MTAKRTYIRCDELEPRTVPATLVSQVRDLNLFTVNSNPKLFADVNGILYFQANDGVSGEELWRSDGTSSGTRMVRDLAPGAAASTPTALYNWNGTLFFAAAGGGAFDNQLWKSDGSSGGTVLVTNVTTGV